MAIWLTAGLWGLLGPHRCSWEQRSHSVFAMPRYVTAGIMSFGCGVLISAVACDLLNDGYQEGGIWPIIAGAIADSGSLRLGSLSKERARASGPGTSRSTPVKVEAGDCHRLTSRRYSGKRCPRFGAVERKGHQHRDARRYLSVQFPGGAF